jgi:hypothetical protein
VIAAPVRPHRRYRPPAPGPEPELAVPKSNPDIEYDAPDWRYRLAGQLAAEQAAQIESGVEPDPLPRTLDPLLGREVIPFMRARHEVKTARQRAELTDRYPGLTWAVGVNESARMTRYRLEALFVGGAGVDDAANALNTERNFVWWYERLFFDLREHANDPNWIQDHVFVPALRQGTLDARYNLVWKLVAGLYGWRVFLDGNDGVIQPLTTQVVTGITEMVRNRAAEDAFMAQITRVINRYNNLAVVEEHHRAEDVEIRKLGAMDEDRMDDSAAALAALAQPIIAALSVKRASARDVPQLEGPMAGVFERRDREIAERERVIAARTIEKELADDA